MTLRSALACAVSTIALFSAEQGYAQETQQSGIETVVVTGVRASVKSSLDIKKKSDQMVDSIVAEDIGKLPDNNVIEALQHVTGVQISRNAAEANQLLIRGLPDIATLLNGREIFTSTGRFVTLQDIPAELLARVDVEKSPRADDIEGGIAGLIDVRLHRPFDFDGLVVAGTAQGTHSSLSGATDGNASLLVSDRWSTGIGDMGLLVDLSYRQDHYKEEILDNYIDTQAIGPVQGSTGLNGVAFVPLTEGAQSINGNRQREAANVSFQWTPNDATDIYAELFYTRYRNPNNVDFFVGLPWICANAATATVFPGTDLVKTVTGGCYDLTSDQSFVPKTDTYQAATGANWTQGDLTLTTEFDYTDSQFSQTGYILDTHYFPGTYTADFNYHNTGTPYMNVTSSDVTDPAQMFMRQFYDQWSKQTGNEFDWRGDLQYDMGETSFVKSIDAGVRYGNRFAENHQANGSGLDCGGVADPGSSQYQFQLLKDHSPACGFPNSGGIVALNDPSLPGTPYHVTSGSQFGGKFGITRWMDADPNWLNNYIGALREEFGQSASPPPADPSQTFSDREQSYAGYVKANFGFDLGSLPVDGNVGLRLIDTDADKKGFTTVITITGSNYVYTYLPTDNASNTVDWLPSLNLRMQLEDDLFLRVAASQTVTHPTFAQLNPGLSLQDFDGDSAGLRLRGQSRPQARQVGQRRSFAGILLQPDGCLVRCGVLSRDRRLHPAGVLHADDQRHQLQYHPARQRTVGAYRRHGSRLYAVLHLPAWAVERARRAGERDVRGRQFPEHLEVVVQSYRHLREGAGVAAGRLQLARRVQRRSGSGRRSAAWNHLRQVAALARLVGELSAE